MTTIESLEQVTLKTMPAKLIEKLSNTCGRFWNSKTDSPFILETISLEQCENCLRFPLLSVFLAMNTKIFHENLLKIQNIELPSETRECYFVYESDWYLLDNLLDANIFENDQKYFILYNILITLEYFHKFKLVLCNLCPQNILVSDVCNIKIKGILDLKIIRDLLQNTDWQDENQPGLNDLLSTEGKSIALNYYSPEIIFGGSPSCASDLWSFGVILYELATGKRLFSNTNKNDMIGSLLNFFEIQTDQVQNQLKKISGKNVRDIEILSQLKVCLPSLSKNMLLNSVKDKALREVISKLLQLEPDSRTSCQDLLKLPVFRHYDTARESEFEENEFWQTLKDKKDLRDARERVINALAKPMPISKIDSMGSETLLDNLNRVFDHDGNKFDFFAGLYKISFEEFVNYFRNKFSLEGINRAMFNATVFDFLATMQHR